MNLNTYVNSYVAAAELEQAVILAERARVAAERLTPRPTLLQRLRRGVVAGTSTARRGALGARRELSECTTHAA